MAAQVVIQTLAGAGDEIMQVGKLWQPCTEGIVLILHCIYRVPTPYYFNHSMCLDMLGVRLQPLECEYEPKEQGFIPSVEEARTLINESTRAILLVSPNNRKLHFFPLRQLP